MRIAGDIYLSNTGWNAFVIGLVVVVLLQLWAVAEAATRREWKWLAAVVLLAPAGAVAWVVFGRRRRDR